MQKYISPMVLVQLCIIVILRSWLHTVWMLRALLALGNELPWFNSARATGLWYIFGLYFTCIRTVTISCENAAILCSSLCFLMWCIRNSGFLGGYNSPSQNVSPFFVSQSKWFRQRLNLLHPWIFQHCNFSQLCCKWCHVGNASKWWSTR